METLDVVTTAIRRPVLLDLTYQSFFKRIQNLPKVRIILNVDPIGDAKAEDCLKIAKKYSDNVVFRSPNEPNFSASVNWCWSQIESAYFLHIEDDWLLKKTIEFTKWLNDLITKNVAQSVLIMKRPRTSEKLVYSFRPHLGVKKNIMSIHSIPEHLNPEKFVARKYFKMTSADFSDAGSRTIEDMGSKWAKANGLKKAICNHSEWFSKRMTNPFFKVEYQYFLLKWRYLSGYIYHKSI